MRQQISIMLQIVCFIHQLLFILLTNSLRKQVLSNDLCDHLQLKLYQKTKKERFLGRPACCPIFDLIFEIGNNCC
jgi:hypothetical protein